MSLKTLLPSAGNCGLLLLPILAWNLLFFAKLPPEFAPSAFNRDIPGPLSLLENGLRLFVFALPFFMPLALGHARQRLGLAVFLAGTALYFASWIPLMIAPASGWSRSGWGFLAPAYTPGVWLIGLSLLGQSLFFGTFYRWWIYLGVSLGFLAAHLAHVAIVFARSH